MSEQRVSEYPTTDVLACSSCGKQIEEVFVIDNVVAPSRALHPMCAAMDFGEKLRDARAKIARLREELRECVDLAEEGWYYADNYVQKKWDAYARLNKARVAIGEE